MRTGSSGVGDGDTGNSQLTDEEYSQGLWETAERLREEREVREQIQKGRHWSSMARSDGSPWWRSR